MKLNANNRHVSAFTLIELLVVISIIALLVGILLPGGSAPAAAPQKAVCLSNVRQAGVAIYTYATDNDEFHPQFVSVRNSAPYRYAADSRANLTTQANGDPGYWWTSPPSLAAATCPGPRPSTPDLRRHPRNTDLPPAGPDDRRADPQRHRPGRLGTIRIRLQRLLPRFLPRPALEK
ncbi:MAG: type II secretion system protein [Phycisphaerales bacterium]